MNVGDWLQARTVYITLAGSRAYGLNTSESDWDYRGAAVPPKNYFFGLDRFEQADAKTTINTLRDAITGRFETKDAEITIWSLQKMVHLASDCNPNMIELMFMPDKHIVHLDPVLSPLFDIRRSFLSQVLKHRFSGYAFQQLKRMRNHEEWVKNPPHQPTREEFGIEGISFPKDDAHAIRKIIEFQVEDWAIDQTELPESIKIQLIPEMVRIINVVLEQLQIEADTNDPMEILERAAVRNLGFDSNFQLYLQKEKAYRAAQKQYQSYVTWKENRNAIRHELELKFGIDTKFALHTVRLLRMCREALERHEINVDRTGIDAEELMDIRYNGIWSHEKLVEWAGQQDKELTDLMPICGLPKSPDRKKINEVLTEVTNEYLANKAT